MGFLTCPLPCKSNEESESQSHSNLHSESSTSCLSSQQSLPSVPSLTPPSHQETTNNQHSCISTLKGHTTSIFSLTLSGKHLYTGSSDSQIRKWSRQPCVPENPSHNIVVTIKSAVKSLVMSGDKLFSAHHDKKIRVWKIDNDNNNNHTHNNYKCVAVLPTLNDRFSRLFSSKNYVKVRRHNKCTWVHHVDTVSALALTKDGSMLYSVSWDRTFKVWRTSDFKCLESVSNAHDDAINAIVLSNDGFVYTGSADRKIKVWKKEGDDKKHRLVSTLEKHKSSVNALGLSHDGCVLYSGACDRSIIVWEKDGGVGHMVVAGALRGHTKAILCLAVVSDLVCSGSADKTVRVWRKDFGIGKSYSCLAVFEGHTGPVKCMTASVDSSNNGNNSTSYLLYSGSLDYDIKIWQLRVPLT